MSKIRHLCNLFFMLSDVDFHTLFWHKMSLPVHAGPEINRICYLTNIFDNWRYEQKKINMHNQAQAQFLNILIIFRNCKFILVWNFDLKLFSGLNWKHMTLYSLHNQNKEEKLWIYCIIFKNVPIKNI